MRSRKQEEQSCVRNCKTGLGSKLILNESLTNNFDSFNSAKVSSASFTNDFPEGDIIERDPSEQLRQAKEIRLFFKQDEI